MLPEVCVCVCVYTSKIYIYAGMPCVPGFQDISYQGASSTARKQSHHELEGHLSLMCETIYLIENYNSSAERDCSSSIY